MKLVKSVWIYAWMTFYMVHNNIDYEIIHVSQWWQQIEKVNKKWYVRWNEKWNHYTNSFANKFTHLRWSNHNCGSHLLMTSLKRKAKSNWNTQKMKHEYLLNKRKRVTNWLLNWRDQFYEIIIHETNDAWKMEGWRKGLCLKHFIIKY